MPTPTKTTPVMPSKTAPAEAPEPQTVGVPTTAAPAAPWLGAGAGTAASQGGAPRLANYEVGGWGPTPAPMVDHIVPVSGANTVAVTLEVYGTWAPGAVIMVAGAALSATVDNGTHLSASYTPSTVGAKAVGIRNPDTTLSNTVPYTVS